MEERIGSLEAATPTSRFKATKDGREIAEGASLDELASKLKARGVNPREVRILSASPVRQVVRAGLRGKRA